MPTWKTGHGTLIEIETMTDDHINNAIGLCHRKIISLEDDIVSATAMVSIVDPNSFTYSSLIIEKDAREEVLERFKTQMSDLLAEAERRNINAGVSNTK